PARDGAGPAALTGSAYRAARGSVAGEDRLALLEERGAALLMVAREQERALSLALPVEELVEPAGEMRLRVGGCERRPFREDRRARVRRLERLPLRDHAIDEPDAQRLGGVDGLGVEQHLLGIALADAARQGVKKPE